MHVATVLMNGPAPRQSAGTAFGGLRHRRSRLQAGSRDQNLWKKRYPMPSALHILVRRQVPGLSRQGS